MVYKTFSPHVTKLFAEYYFYFDTSDSRFSLVFQKKENQLEKQFRDNLFKKNVYLWEVDLQIDP